MSQENVDTVKAAFAAWNTGDMDAFREFLHRDVIMRAPEGWPEPGPFAGRDAVMGQWEQARDVWDADTLEPTSDFVSGADRVVVRVVWNALGRGPASSLEFTWVGAVRKGRLFGVEFFWDHAEALEALGLSEQDAHD